MVWLSLVSLYVPSPTTIATNTSVTRKKREKKTFCDIYFVFIYWFCWLIVLIWFFGFTFSSSYFHNILYVRWPVVISDTWTVSNIKLLHYLRLSESFEKLRNRKMRWKCKIKYRAIVNFVAIVTFKRAGCFLSTLPVHQPLIHKKHTTYCAQ